jgi:phosphate transport system substrate-binding protein
VPLAHRAVIAALAISVCLAGGSGCSRPASGGVTLAGSTSLQPFAERWADAFTASHPGVSVHVQGGGSTAGVVAAMTGAAEIGMSSRALTSAETERATAIPVARDVMVIVVHPTNPLRGVSLEDVRSIYAGASTSWRAFGGRPVPITVITREEGSGTRAAFEELVMARRRIVASALVQDATGAVRQMVASDPAAIGYVSLGFVDGSVKALALDGVAASEANVDSGGYPLVRPFLFVARGPLQGAAAAFVAWLRGPEGRALTRRDGLLPPRS